MEDKKSFGEYIYKKRTEIGLTQKEFAEKLFITESAVSKWERGLSYPDITLVSEISKILSVSEHELLTASVDVEARNSKKLALKYIRLVNQYKNILSIIYAASLVTCFICNLAVQHNLSWFFIVLLSELVAISLTLVPVMVQERKGLYTIGSFTASLILLLMVCCIYTGGNWFFISVVSVLFGLTLIFLPYLLHNISLPDFLYHKKVLLYFITETILLLLLLLVCNQYTNGNWLFTIAVPITAFSLTLPWGMMLIIRYIKINKYFKTAGCLALVSAFEYVEQGVINYILKEGSYDLGFRSDLFRWSGEFISDNIRLIIFIIFIILTILFTVLGCFRAFKKDKC
jgi:transcriptional regulator with XRE-family HTH domain